MLTSTPFQIWNRLCDKKKNAVWDLNWWFILVAQPNSFFYVPLFLQKNKSNNEIERWLLNVELKSSSKKIRVTSVILHPKKEPKISRRKIIFNHSSQNIIRWISLSHPLSLSLHMYKQQLTGFLVLPLIKMSPAIFPFYVCARYTHIHISTYIHTYKHVCVFRSFWGAANSTFTVYLPPQ